MLRSLSLLPGTQERMTQLSPDHLPLAADLDGDQIIERLPIHHGGAHPGPEPQ